eukprot:CAMPEP_0197438464 /NCGR_PEP_ID=MMETSP1175-20131217/5456_1 /TAXON_ID=1003142 /ORGANISM="Triceratium dubium, Strain CCMP147" /LENGTH=425 /DNA_ID=CAMNT_0042968209 /DNA_START=151 /DNA_END=1428 /DNA_ORIENTATION=+
MATEKEEKEVKGGAEGEGVPAQGEKTDEAKGDPKHKKKFMNLFGAEREKTDEAEGDEKHTHKKFLGVFPVDGEKADEAEGDAKHKHKKFLGVFPVDGEKTDETEGDDEDKHKKFMGMHLDIDMPKMDLTKKKKQEAEPPSLLWEHIDTKDWEGVTKDLDGDDITDLVRMWHNENLPLHGVCKKGKSPDEIILKVLSLYPEAAKVRGKNRMLPLQLALNHKHSFGVIRALILAYPDALDARIDDKNVIRLETTRTWIDLQSHPADVKKLIQRSTADWKVIRQYHEDQNEQHDKLISMQKKLKTAKKKTVKAEAATKSLAERIHELEVANEIISGSIDDEIQANEDRLKGRLAEIKERLEAFQAMQEAKNKELLYDLSISKHRGLVFNAVIEAKREELLGLFKESLKNHEQLGKELRAERLQKELST